MYEYIHGCSYTNSPHHSPQWWWCRGVSSPLALFSAAAPEPESHLYCLRELCEAGGEKQNLHGHERVNNLVNEEHDRFKEELGMG